MKRKGSTLFSIGWAFALSGMIWACAGTDFAGSTKASTKKKESAGKADNDDSPGDEENKNPGKGTSGGTPSKATDNGTSGGTPSKGTGSGNPGKGTDNATTGAGTSTDKSTAGPGVNTDNATTGAGTKGGTPGKAGTDVDDTGDTSTDGSGSEDPGELSDEGGTEKVLTSALTLRTDYDKNNECKGDGQVMITVSSYKDGVPTDTTVPCPKPGESVVIPGGCRTTATTCIKLRFVNTEDNFTGDTWSDQKNFIVSSPSVEFDIDGCLFGTCVDPGDDAKITLSCEKSPSIDMTQSCM